jgi:hypothetical protein
MLDRRSALYVFAVNLPLWPMLGVLAGCMAGSVIRAAWCLLTKQQRKAAAHIGAVAWLLRHPLLLRRERRRRAADRKHGYAVLRGQLPRARTLGRLAESAMGIMSRGSGYNSGGLHHAMVDEPGDDMPLPATDSSGRRLFTMPGVLLFVGLAVVALVAERSLTGSVLSGTATFGGGVLVPSYSGAGSLWHEYLAGYHDTGIGSAASTPAYVGVLAALSTLFGGKPWLVTDVLLLGCVPLAGMTAFLATRRLTSVLAARIWIAASYALLPVATGAVAAGRIGTVVAFVLLPLIGGLVGRVLTGNPRTAARAAWGAGLLTGVTAAFVPLAWPVVVIAAVAATAAWSWLGPRTVLNAWIVAVVPGVLLIPWTFHLVTSPSAFFAEAGLVRPGLAAAALRPGSLLLLSPGGPGLPPAWVTVGLVLPAFAALLARRRTVLVYAGWGVALGGLILALAVSRATVTPPQGGAAVSAWPGLAIAIAAAGLLLAATPLIEAIGRALIGKAGAGRADPDRSGRPAWRFAAAVAGLAAVVSAPALAAGYWLANGLGGPVTAAGLPILPAFVAASATGPDRARTLVLRQDAGTLSYAVLRAADPVPGEPELAETAASRNAMESVVASLPAAGSGDAGDTGRALSRFGIGYVLLADPADQPLAGQLNTAAGLQPLTRSSSYDLWQVSGTVARARVVTPSGTAVAVPSGPVGSTRSSPRAPRAPGAGGGRGRVVRDPRRQAADPLAAPVDGWAQGFTLPAGGGHLVITRNETARNLSLGARRAALFVVVVLALPGSRSSVPAPAAPPRRCPGARRPGRGHPVGPPQAAAAVRAGARTAGRGARAQDGDDTEAATRWPRGTATADPFGTHDDPGYGPAYPPARHLPARTPEPALGVAAHLDDEDPAPWAGLGPQISQTPALRDRPDPAPALPAPAPPAPPAPPVSPRRGRGAHAARHGKPSRRSRGEG